MAGDAAGQITASLTLDISKFTKALGDAKKAVESMQKTASQAASAGGGGDAATESMKKTSEAAKKQKQALSNLVLEYKNLRHNFRQGAQSQEEYKKSMQGVVNSANALKAATDSKSKSYEKFNNVAGMAAAQVTKIENSQKREAAAAKKAQLALEKKSQAQERSSRSSSSQKKELTGLALTIDTATKKTIHFANATQAQIMPVKQAQTAIFKEIQALEKLASQEKLTTQETHQLSKALAKMNNMMMQTRGADNLVNKMMRAELAGQTNATMMGKVGNAFKGIASNTRVAVMGITNLSEAFQKTLIGGRQMYSFLIGDFFDAIMIGSMAGPKGAAIAAAGFVLSAAAGHVAKMMGFLQKETTDGAAASKRAAESFRRASEELVPLETNLDNASDAMAGFIERSNRLELIDLDKALMPTQALVSAINKLNNIKLTGPQQEARKIAAFFQFARENVDMLIQRLFDLNDMELILGGAEESRRLTKEISNLNSEIAKLEIQEKYDPRGIEARLEGLRKERDLLYKQRIDVDKERRVKAEEIKRVTGALAAQEAMVGEQVKAEKKLKAILDEINKANGGKGKTSFDSGVAEPEMREGLDQLNEMIKVASQLRSELAKTEASYIDMGMAKKDQQEMVAVDPRLKELKRVEGFITQHVEEYRHLQQEADFYFEGKPEDQKAAFIKMQQDEMQKLVALYREADKFGIGRPSLTGGGGTPEEIARVSAEVDAAKKVFGFMDNFSSRTKELTKLSGDLAETIKSDVLVALVDFADGLVKGISDMASGNFGQVYAMAGEGIGKAIGAKFGDPKMGGEIGKALGGLADMMVGRIKITSPAGEEYGMGEVIQSAFDQPLNAVADAFMPLAEASHLLASNFGGFLAQMITTFKPLISAVGTIFSSVFEVIANVFGALMPVFLLLASVINPVAKLFAAIVRVFTPITNLLLGLASVLATLIMTLTGLTPILMLLAPAVDTLAKAIMGLALLLETGIAKFGETIAKAIESFAEMVRGVVEFLREIDVLGLMGDSISALANGIDALAGNVRNAANGFGAFANGMDETIAGMDEERRMRSDANKEASKVLNAPKGFKVEKYRYEAMSPEQSNPYMTGTSIAGQNMNVMIEAIYVADGDDLLERLDEAKRTGGFSPLGGN